MQEDNVAVIVGTITDDTRVFEVPALKVCALKVTATARARILKVCPVQFQMAWLLVVCKLSHGCFVPDLRWYWLVEAGYMPLDQKIPWLIACHSHAPMEQLANATYRHNLLLPRYLRGRES